jgi:hypothetical protein
MTNTVFKLAAATTKMTVVLIYRDDDGEAHTPEPYRDDCLDRLENDELNVAHPCSEMMPAALVPGRRRHQCSFVGRLVKGNHE